ncbi:MAG: type VI secretion system baseplate subunit TssE [Rhodopirellula sp.]|nr:type VI secretion system baseplate subunit TssE [Rhodopirellula sp.]
MPDAQFKEKLFPSLLDRLTDDSPMQQKESREKRVFSVAKLREAVLRDLAWLLNTCHLQVVENLSGFPFVQTSVVNYGIPDMTGKTLSGLDVFDLEQALKRSIIQFEPRILADTLEVRGLLDDDASVHNCLAFEIEGELWARPIPERLFLRTELDLETGSVTLKEE